MILIKIVREKNIKWYLKKIFNNIILKMALVLKHYKIIFLY